MSIIKKKRIVFFTTVFSLLNLIGFTQVIFEDKYLKLQEYIASSTTYANIVDEMKSKNYKLDTRGIDEENKSEYLAFSGNHSQLVVAIYSQKKELLIVQSNLLSLNVVFCENELEHNEFQKIETINEEYEDEKWVEIKWGKTGYPYQFVVEHVSDNICWMYLHTPLMYNNGKVVEKKEQVITPKKQHDFSTMQKFADTLNAHLFRAQLDHKKSSYWFTSLGKIDFEKTSLKFIVKNNELYIKTHLLKDGECDYGIQEVKAKFSSWGGALIGTNNNLTWINFDYNYSCNENSYTELHIILHKPTKAFLKETLEKFEACCR